MKCKRWKSASFKRFNLSHHHRRDLGLEPQTRSTKVAACGWYLSCTAWLQRKKGCDRRAVKAWNHLLLCLARVSNTSTKEATGWPRASSIDQDHILKISMQGLRHKELATNSQSKPCQNTANKYQTACIKGGDHEHHLHCKHL